MNEITLKRGSGEVTLKKLPEYFAVRLKRGRAPDEEALEAAAGTPQTKVRHVESAASENFEIFAVQESDTLEETTDELREASTTEVVTHMYTVDDTPEGTVIPTGTMTIQFVSDVEREKREAILAEFGLEILEELDFVDRGYTVRLTEASTKNPLKIADDLLSRNEIETAEPDLSFRVSPESTPVDAVTSEYTSTDTLYRLQWHLKNRGDSDGLVADADVKAEEAWDYTKGTRNITVCVMDDGFDLEHPDFDGPGKIVGPRDFGGRDFDPSPGSEDDNHGTACAGVAIAEENGTGVVGLAPRCSFMPVRTSGWLSDQSITTLFQYVINQHADVISCSWSASAWNFPLSTKIHGIIRKAATQGRQNGKGCVILFAAGNQDRPLDGEKDGNRSVQGFALHPNVIAVGASNSRDERSYYSNFGPELTLCAPSNGNSWEPDGSLAVPIVTTDRRGTAGYNKVGDLADYAYFGGTSSATPLAAGLAGLILSLNPALSSAEVTHVMMDTADKIDEQNGEYDEDGHSPWYGHGRINAHRAAALVVNDDGEDGLPQVLSMEHRINRSIPDGGEVEDTISFPLAVDPEDLEVSVEIRHTWRGDLRVNLTSPQGGEITLIDRAGGSQDDIVRSFRSSDDPELFGEALGASPEGDWRLKVIDMAEGDKGTIVKWGLAVTYTE